MLKKVLLQVWLLFSVAGLLSASSLQYTHDTTHHTCPSHAAEQHALADDCALCWFVSHQIVFGFRVDVVLPEAQVSSRALPKFKAFSLALPESAPSLKSNKDPPFFA
ncbi:hypothetical protein [Sphingobacterium deserti]|uniref:DUF2946 domain-containing protein n=1 Tax=Sphingobacterium deserti TaxID=1229276 RepID=A0A0B8T5Q8_9SPHI|nr:hypothetical protein [Sphingobacterium deserti]KGE16043.1 hypothetical protein DI53_0158 [Sphingobacterium deserti]